MTGQLWRGQWYVYHSRRREFLRQVSRAGAVRNPKRPDATEARWTPGIRLARAYKNPSMAQKAANRLNELERGGLPIRVVTVVTGEAARCLDLINQRDHGA